MEARKKYYTFSQALEKIMEDPNNLVMTRTPYISEGPSVIRELLPNVESDFPDKPILVRVDSTGLWEYFPTQEDMHSMTWMVLRNGVKPTGKDEPVPEDLTEDGVRDPLTEGAVKELTKVLQQFNKLLDKLICG